MYSKRMVQQKALKKSIKENLVMTPSPVLKHAVKDEIWLLENAISKQDCLKLIDMTEKLGYEQALLNTSVQGEGYLDKSVRDHQRIMIDDFDSAKQLYESLQKYVPLCQQGAVYSSINERFRFLKYFPENVFREHVDGRFPRGNEVSVLTLQIYLNDVEKGGSTRFYDPRLKGEKLDVNPKTGSLVVFKQSDWLHSGEPVEKGVKYTIRTDIMYRWLKQDEAKDFVQKSDPCQVCNSKPKLVNCDRCVRHVVVCGCQQFSTWSSKKRKHLLICSKCLGIE